MGVLSGDYKEVMFIVVHCHYKLATDKCFRTVDQMKRMECSYVCEVLHFLLRERHGTPLVKLPVDLVDKDNEASLDLLCALFKHCECHEKCYDYTVDHLAPFQI